jgi:TnpA family transposase
LTALTPVLRLLTAARALIRNPYHTTRIRNLHELKLYRPSPESVYAQIDALFAEPVDWDLIATHLPDVLRIVLSIKEGRMTASTILRKLSTYSHKNKLYQAFREVGRVVRTAFPLQYLSDPDLRATIQAATNKSEAFTQLVHWVAFGNGA